MLQFAAALPAIGLLARQTGKFEPAVVELAFEFGLLLASMLDGTVQLLLPDFGGGLVAQTAPQGLLAGL